MKNSLERLNNRFEHVEERQNLRQVNEIIHLEVQREKRTKEKKSKRPVEHHVYQQMYNVCPKGRGEREKKMEKKGQKKYLKK